MPRNPFLAGTIIEASRFVGRQAEIEALKSSIETRQSVCIIGEPHIGKSCLLYYLRNSQFSSWLPADEEWAFILRDGMDLGSSVTPAKFWQSIFREALKTWKDGNLKKALSPKIAALDRSLENVRVIFEKLRANRKNLILLLDEFDGMVSNSNLAYFEFWGQIRHLAGERSLCFIGASRKDRFQMNAALNAAMKNKISELHDFGSPIFNVAQSLYIKHFPEQDIDELFAPVLCEQLFSDLDYQVVRRLAGGHPYLLQAVGAKIWHTRSSGRELIYPDMVEGLLEELNDHFRDTWDYLKENGNSCILAALLVLREIGQNTYDLSVLNKNIELFHMESRSLERAGVVRRKNGETQLASSLFALWVQQTILVQPPENLDDFLRSKAKKLGGMTEEQQRKVAHVIGEVYREIKSVVTDFGISKKLLGLP